MEVILKSMADVENVKKKITELCQLPSYKEAKALFNYYQNHWFNMLQYSDEAICPFDCWFKFCNENDIYNVYNIEFVNALADEIKKLNLAPVAEICAGNGKLSYHLRERGIDIIATDDYSFTFIERDEKLVERLSHRETLEKYKPRIVVAAWIPFGSEIELEILKNPHVKHLIVIGDRKCCGSQACYKSLRNLAKPRLLKDVTQYSLCRSDDSETVESIEKRRSRVEIFDKIASSS
ncbi:MAG: hypothetical protein J7K72_01335 [Candidatus Aenigmarchaeota archaeon]|nr:hypothetical protein [Candidatus Aenigmarchaeota archaeon]